MPAEQKHDIADGLNEEYYQISADILGSFNKYRPPLNIFMFKEDVARVMPFFKVGGRLTNEQVEELAEMTKEGLVFVSREDHPVYVKHISYQLDLVLVDKNLKEKEIADIFTQVMGVDLLGRLFIDGVDDGPLRVGDNHFPAQWNPAQIVVILDGQAGAAQ